MLPTEEQNNGTKETMKAAWEEGDLWRLACAGIDNFINMLCSSTPIPFQRFLEYTGVSFDKYILETVKKERLNYIGGKMILNLEKDSAIICLAADFYFQTSDKRWVMKKKKGQVETIRFSDWNTDADAAKLQEAGKLELSIEPPETGVT